MLSSNYELEPAISLLEMKARAHHATSSLSTRCFEANETTRISNTYFLPSLYEGLLPWQSVNYHDVIDRMVKSKNDIKILDLGCGSGFWMEEINAASTFIETFGISAKDYRLACQRPQIVKDTVLHLRTNSDLVFRGEHGQTYFSDVDLLRDSTIDDEHYRIGDVLDQIKLFPTNYFDIVVSNQACKYFIDPLRVLKQTYRVLKPKGYAFLESMCPVIYQGDNPEPIPDDAVYDILKRTGLKCTYGEYTFSGLEYRRGLAFKKTKSRINLPFSYRDVEHHPGTKTDYLTYSLAS